MDAGDGARVTHKAWPPLVALVVVVLMSFVVLAVDVVVDRQTQSRTRDLVDDALRSVTLADDLRSQAHTLASPAIGREKLAAVVAHIARDAATYDPLATYAGERVEWDNLQGLLARLQQSQASGATAVEPGLLDGIETSLDRIVDINRREAMSNVAEIRSAYHEGFVVDAVGGAVTLAMAMAIAIALVRSLLRQRALLAVHLESEQARQRELEAFASRVAHDLRGPLLPIRTYADLLRSGAGPPPSLIGELIATGADRMALIIEELLTLSTSGQLADGRADVARVITQVLDEVKPQLQGARVVLQIADGAVRCSPVSLGRIVQNLVSNAIKYRAPDRPLELAIRASRAGEAVELVVSDNGIGMDATTAARVFEPLFRADAVRTLPGHGLGMAIVKRTIDALGGTCTVASELGEGTRISVQLPVA